MKSRLLIILGIFLLIINFCFGTAIARSGDKMTVGLSQEPSNLDPAQAWNGWYCMQFGIGETLFRFNEKMEIEPWLARSIKQLENLSWEVRLQENVRFHNGHLMDAKAVKASLERCLELNSRAPGLLKIASIKVKGSYDLIISTTKPNPSLPNYLADPMTVIVDAEAAEQKGSDFFQNPVLTGPFIVDVYQPNIKIVVKPNPDYWDGSSKLEQVTFNFISDSMSRLMALQAGQIEIASNIPPVNIPIIERQEDLQVLSRSSLRVHMIYFNLSRSPLDNLEVRKAISQVIDRKVLAENVMGNSAIPAVGPFPPILPFRAEDIKGEAYELKAAQKLLENAGWKLGPDKIRSKNGKQLRLKMYTYSSRPELPLIAEAIQYQLEELGIKLEINIVENISKILKSADYDLALYSMNTAPVGDPEYFLRLTFSSNGSANYSGFYDPEVDSLIEQLSSTFVSSQRYELARRIQKIIMAKIPNLFLVYPKINMGVNKSVNSYTVYPSEFYLLNKDVGLD